MTVTFSTAFVTKVVEVDNKKVTTFEGNYTAYSQKKAMLREAAYHAWVNQQQEIHHQEEVIAKLKSFNREKSIKRAESREKCWTNGCAGKADRSTLRYADPSGTAHHKRKRCADRRAPLQSLPGTDAFPGSEFRNQARRARGNHRKQRNGKTTILKDLKTKSSARMPALLHLEAVYRSVTTIRSIRCSTWKRPFSRRFPTRIHI